MISQCAKPIKIEIETLVALVSIRLLSKALFDIFEDREMQSALKLLCQALLEKEEIEDEDKKALLDFLYHFEFNYYH